MKVQSKFKVLSLFLILMVFIVCGCEKKNEDYYLNHPEKAKSKIASTENIITELAKAGNTKKMEQLISDPEFNAAQKALSTIREEEEKIRKIQLEKERAEKKKQTELFLKEHYKHFAEIPLVERMKSRSPFVNQWKKKCKEVTGDFMSLDCYPHIPGLTIYQKSYEKFLKDRESREKQHQKCIAYKKEFKADYNFNSRRNILRMLEGNDDKGTNECHAAYDAIINSLAKEYVALPLEQRADEMVKCMKLEDDDICKDSLDKANEQIAHNLEDKFNSDERAKKEQVKICKTLFRKWYDIKTSYGFAMRKMGECKAANFH